MKVVLPSEKDGKKYVNAKAIFVLLGWIEVKLEIRRLLVGRCLQILFGMVILAKKRDGKGCREDMGGVVTGTSAQWYFAIGIQDGFQWGFANCLEFTVLMKVLTVREIFSYPKTS
jgi:hypothetical protein